MVPTNNCYRRASQASYSVQCCPSRDVFEVTYDDFLLNIEFLAFCYTSMEISDMTHLGQQLGIFFIFWLWMSQLGILFNWNDSF